MQQTGPTAFAIIATAFAISSVGIWFFQDSLRGGVEKDEMIRQKTLNEAIIRVGPEGRCGVDVHLTVWPDLNQLEVYRWVIACMDAQKKQVEN